MRNAILTSCLLALLAACSSTEITASGDGKIQATTKIRMIGGIESAIKETHDAISMACEYTDEASLEAQKNIRKAISEANFSNPEQFLQHGAALSDVFGDIEDGIETAEKFRGFFPEHIYVWSGTRAHPTPTKDAPTPSDG